MTVSKNIAKRVLRQTWFRKDCLRPRKEEKPFLVRLDINNTCNMLCDKCFYPDYASKKIPPHWMSPDQYRLLAARLFDYAYCVQIACGFESLLHPQYVEIMEITDRYDIPFLSMVTNGSLLKGEKARAIAHSKNMKVLSVSLDAVSPAIFEKVRGRPFLEAVLQNIESFQALRRATGSPYPVLNINTRIMRSTLHDLPRILEWCGERAIEKVQFFHVCPFGKENDESVFHVPEEYNKVRENLLKVAGKYPLEFQMPPPLEPKGRDSETGGSALFPESCKNQETETTDPRSSLPHPYPRGVFCLCPWMLISVDCYGDLRPCGWRTEDVYGNILRQSFEDALNSIKILKLRRAIRKGRREGICRDCRASVPYAEPMTERLPGIVF